MKLRGVGKRLVSLILSGGPCARVFFTHRLFAATAYRFWMVLILIFYFGVGHLVCCWVFFLFYISPS